MKKLIGLLVLTLLISGCTGEPPIQDQQLPYTELNMYLIGKEPEDTELVYGELNKLILSELNAKLNVHFISWEDREQKYDQILSSGVAVDLIYTSDWSYYDEQARKGTFYEINMKDLETYMPQTFANQPKEAFEQAMIDGKMYMVPNYQEEFADYKLALIRGDLRQAYGLEPLKSLSDLETYYAMVRKYNPDLLPYGASLDNKELSYVGFWQVNGLVRVITNNKASSFAIRYQEGKSDYDLVNILMLPEYLNYLKTMRDWQLRGYWSENAIASNLSAQEAFESGASASLIWNIGTLNLSAIKVWKKNPAWQPEIYELTPSAPKIIAKYTNNGMAVARKSQNFERALMVLDKLKNDERYWNLTWLGIEGVHWKAVAPNQYEVLEAASRFPYAETSCWGWGNKPYQREAVETPEDSRRLIRAWTDSYTMPRTHFFRFDDAPVREQSSEILDILSRYQPILELGMVEDVEGTYAAMLKALDAAGWATYEAEFRRQYEAFMASEVK